MKPPSQSDQSPRSYGCFCPWSGLKYSGATYLDAGICLSPECQSHTRMAGLKQYQEIARTANFYWTTVSGRGECVDSKDVHLDQIR